MLFCEIFDCQNTGLPSGVLGCPRLVLGYGMGVGLGLRLGVGGLGHPRTVVGNPR